MTYDILNDIYYTNFISTKESEASKDNYEKTLRKFSQALNLPLKDIITNCKNQQEIITEKIISHGTDEDGNQIIEKKITSFDINNPESSLIKQYFDKYIQHCQTENNSNNTIFVDLNHINTFLNFYAIQYPKTNFKRTNSKWNLLEKEDIKFIMDDSTITHKTLISTLKDTGLRLGDALKLTLDDFMTGTKEYHDFIEVDDFIDNAPKDMICTLELIPHKTKRFNLQCITFIGPETCNLILQNFKRIKNEYLPKINKEQELNLKVSKSDALFGNKRKYYKGPMQVKSISSVFGRKNKKLYNWRIAKIEDQIKEGKLSIEDKDKAIEKIPKFHAHGLRKFFQTTIARNCGNLRICTLLEGHTPPVKTDPSYIQIDVDEVKEAYLLAMPDLSLENIETKVYTSEVRRETEAKIKALEKENEELKQKNEEDFKELWDEINNMKSRQDAWNNLGD